MDVADQHGVLEKFGRDIVRLSVRTRDRWKQRAFAFWRRRGFPYPELDDFALLTEWNALCRIRMEKAIVHGTAQVNTIGLRLANAFHPQMWEISCHGKSPVESFRQDETLRKAVDKAYRFYPNRRCWNAQCIRSLMRFSHRSRVSNFRPAIARALYDRYSPTQGRILDFSAGFGGRLLAALSLDRSYVGIDPSRRQVIGLERMIKHLRPFAPGRAMIIKGAAEDVLSCLGGNSFDLVFTSPPYYRTERYDAANEQSWVRYKTYREWRDGFLATVIEEGCRVLRPGGYFLLNVKDTPEWPIATDCRALFPRIFRVLPTLRYLLPTQPQQRSSLGILYRWEPILIFRRPSLTP